MPTVPFFLMMSAKAEGELRLVSPGQGDHENKAEEEKVTAFKFHERTNS